MSSQDLPGIHEKKKLNSTSPVQFNVRLIHELYLCFAYHDSARSEPQRSQVCSRTCIAADSHIPGGMSLHSDMEMIHNDSGRKVNRYNTNTIQTGDAKVKSKVWEFEESSIGIDRQSKCQSWSSSAHPNAVMFELLA